MKLEKLIEELKNQLNKEITINEQGVCRIAIDETMIIVLEKERSGQGFYIYATVGKISPSRAQQLSLEALTGNLFGKETGKANLGYEPSISQLVLFQHVYHECDYHLLKDYLEKFLSYLKHWKKKIEQMEMEPNELHLPAPLTLSKANNLQIIFA